MENHGAPDRVTRIRGHALQRRNVRWLAKHPLCVRCLKKKLHKAAEEVDHIMPLSKGGPDNETNLQGLCKDCHKEKTAEDFNHSVWPHVGADGWPKGTTESREPRTRDLGPRSMRSLESIGPDVPGSVKGSPGSVESIGLRPMRALKGV